LTKLITKVITTITTTMTTNKTIKNLENAINKKQSVMADYARKINWVECELQDLKEATAREEKEIAELKKQQEELRNHKPGQLAKVSIYEFVNDWLRPEVSFQIFQYVADDKHKKGIKKAITHRRKYCRVQKKWCERGCEDHRNWGKPAWAINWSLEPESRTPYTELLLYKEISDHTEIHGDGIVESIEYWVRKGRVADDKRVCDWGHDEGLYKLKHVNPLLRELWTFHLSLQNGTNSNRRYDITKGEIKKYLQMNQVKGRGDLLYGVKCSGFGGVEDFTRGLWSNMWKPPEDRRELVKALMKME